MKRPILLLSAALITLLACRLVWGGGRYDLEAQRLHDLMHWKTGEAIAEIGAGEGQIAFDAAQVVGPGGHVYLTELNKVKLNRLRKAVESRHYLNVSVLAAGEVSTNLPASCCDAIFMRRVYHHLVRPKETDASIYRALKPGGLFAVIDFPPSSWLAPVSGLPPSHGTAHGIAKNLLIDELQSTGFVFVAQSKNWPDHEFNDYCIIAQKPAK